MSENIYCGFDLGGTKMLCVLMDHKKKVIFRERKKTKGADGGQTGIARVIDLIQETLTKSNITPEQLKCIGIGCPGPVDMEKGVVHLAVNLKWKNVPLAQHIEEAFGRPTSVLNDVDAGVYGEYISGVAKGAHSVAGIFPGTGIGGGFVYEGNILRGRCHTGMEIGHTKITSSEHTSGTKMTGTLESEASRLAIAAQCAKLAYRNEAPALLAKAGTDLAAIRSKVLASSIKEGDEHVEQVVRQAARTIGYAAVNLIHLLTPEIIVLGGGLVEALSDLYLEEVKKVVAHNVLECYKDVTKIKIAELGDDAGAIGAGLWAANRFGHLSKSNPTEAENTATQES